MNETCELMILLAYRKRKLMFVSILTGKLIPYYSITKEVLMSEMSMRKH